jgi:signal peptidase I, bacterial type
MDKQNQQANQEPAPYVMPDVPSEPAQRSSKNKGFLRELTSTLAILGSAFGIALLLIAFVFQSYAVDGPSMQVTLNDKDRLIVWKVPRTWARITHHQYVPNRGDVVIFQQAGLAEFGQEDKRQLIKRVVGLPGDRVVVKNGTITIYNTDHPEGFQPDKTLPYGKQTTIPYTGGNIDVTLGDDELYVNGDNRPDSLDSRSFGPIKTDQIVGKLVARILPLGDAELF